MTHAQTRIVGGVQEGKVEIFRSQSIKDGGRCINWRDVQRTSQLLRQRFVQVVVKGGRILFKRYTSNAKSGHCNWEDIGGTLYKQTLSVSMSHR